MTILYCGASQCLEQITLDRDLTHLRDRLAPEVAEMVYYGFWYCAKMDALMAFIQRGAKKRHRRGDARTLQGQPDRRRAAKAPTACTTKASPRWKAAAATTKPTRKASCASRACRCESKREPRRGLTRTLAALHNPTPRFLFRAGPHRSTSLSPLPFGHFGVSGAIDVITTTTRPAPSELPRCVGMFVKEVVARPGQIFTCTSPSVRYLAPRARPAKRAVPLCRGARLNRAKIGVFGISGATGTPS